jgi:hypothetical protein
VRGNLTDGREWHYVRVLGSGLGRFPDISPEATESGIERFAGTLPAPTQLYNLLTLTRSTYPRTSA